MKILFCNSNSNIYSPRLLKKRLEEVSFKASDENFIKNNSSLKIGDEIPNLGIIKSDANVFNTKTKQTENCLIICAKNNDNVCFRLVKNDEKKIKNLSNILQKNTDIFAEFKNNAFVFSEKFLTDIQKISKETAEDAKDLFVSEIVYTYLRNDSDKKRVEELGFKKINPQKDLICIQDFIVHQKEYKNASRYVAIPLLKNLVDNDEKNIIIKAHAFGENSASPVNLYLHYGFLPLNISREEIEKHKIKTDKGMRINPNFHVVMYLPEDAILYKLLKKANLFL